MKQQAVRALLDANPAQAMTGDTFKRMPLHWACMDVLGNVEHDGDGDNDDDKKQSVSILSELLDRAPQALNTVDIERRTPLHYLIARNDRIPLKLLAKMVALAPETLVVKDEVGETPLDILKSRTNEILNAEEVMETMTKLKSMLLLSSSSSSVPK
jgi:ankyrin repeat protein